MAVGGVYLLESLGGPDGVTLRRSLVLVAEPALRWASLTEGIWMPAPSRRRAGLALLTLAMGLGIVAVTILPGAATAP